MQIKDKVNQTVDYVEQYYHLHKRDALKPKIWDLIIAIRYLVHENIAMSKHSRLQCSVSGCSNIPIVFAHDEDKDLLYCEYHSQYNRYCPTCGFSYDQDDSYCTDCEQNRSEMYSLDTIEVDDYDKDYKYDER